MREPTGYDSSTGVTRQKDVDERDKDMSKCEAEEERENEELYSQERKEYVLQAEHERDQNTLMMILTTSRPH
jgi:hypothetical protein